MIEDIINKKPQEQIEFLEIADENSRSALADSIAELWLTDYFVGQSPFQIKNLIRNLSKEPSFVLPFLLYTLQQIGAEMMTEKEEEIRYEKMRGKENVKTKKELEIMISLVDVAKEILRKLGIDFKSSQPPPVKPVEQTPDEPEPEITEEPEPQIAKQPKKQEVQKPFPQPIDEDDEDEPFEIQDEPDTPEEPSIPLVATVSAPPVPPKEQLNNVDEEFSPAITNVYSDLKKLPKDRLLKLEHLSADIPHLYELLSLAKNAETALKIAELFNNKTLREIFDFLALVPLEKEIDNKFVGIIISSLIQSNYIPIMELDAIELELEQITTTLRNHRQLLNIYYNMWLINKKMFPITSTVLKQARLRNDIFSVSILSEQLEKEKMLILILEEFLSFKIGIKIKTDGFYKKEINEANLNLILHFATLNRSNSLLISIYQGYGQLKIEGLPEEKKYKIEDAVPLGSQIISYKPGNIAKELTTALSDICKKGTPPENLDFLGKLVSKYLNIPALPVSDYPSVIRECVQGVLKYGATNNWEMENVISYLAICLFSFSKYTSTPQLGYIAYQITQEIVLGTQNLKYKINEGITGLAKALVVLQNEPIVEDIKHSLEIPGAYDYICKNMSSAVFDTFIDIYESITLSVTTAKTLTSAIIEEKEKFNLEKQKHRLKEVLIIYQ